MTVAGIIVTALTLSSFSLFLLAYRARAILWLDSATTGPRVDEGETKKKTLASQGLYVVEVFSLAIGCYLLTLCLRVLGLSGTDLWVLCLATCAFATLVFAPVTLRRAGRNAATRVLASVSLRQFSAARATLFSETILKPAGRVYSILIGSTGQTPEKGRGKAGEPAHGAVGSEARHWEEVLRLLLRLRERHVSEVMVSRIDMVCAEETSTVSEVAELVREAAYTRVPVFSGTIDTITGYVTAKDVVIRLHQGGSIDAVSSIARKPVYVFSDDTIEHVLEEMQKAHVTLAIVTEPSGRTAGLVTGEDILEEVVGDFYEDYEPDEPAYQVIDDRTAIVRANVALGDLREILGVAPSLSPADLTQTLGAYVRHRLGAEPSRGEQVSDDVFSYSVAKTTGKEIWSLRVEKRK